MLDPGACARFVAALRKLEHGGGRYEPGALLLAQEPNEPSRCAVHALHALHASHPC
jgi:hypothetical protein